METRTIKRVRLTGHIIAILLVIEIGVAAFFNFSKYIEQHEIEASIERLGDYAESNAYATAQELNNALSMIGVAASRFEDMEELHSEKARAMLREISAETPFTQLRLALPDGNSMTGDGEQMDLSDCDYFIRASYGESSVQENVNQETHPGEFLVVSAPIIREGKVIGTLHGEYDLFALSRIVESQSFHDESYSIITNAKGDYIMTSDSIKTLNQGNQNVWEFMKTVNMSGDSSFEKFYSAVQKNESGSLSFRLGDETRAVYYTPLGINNWYLFKLVTYLEIKNNTIPVKNRVFQLTVTMVLLCSALALVVLNMIQYMNREKNQQLKEASVPTL